ncbi:MAG: GTPase HflX [bacterium]
MEKVLLIKLYQNQDKNEVLSDIEEMKGLISTAGGVIVDIISQKRFDISPASYIGKGKAEEIAITYKETVDIIIFDAELKPVQVRNLEDITGKRIVDRTQLILDIFAGRARTNEGKLQVEFAMLNYMLPRLSGRGHDLMQQTGGIGNRKGPGETKLEVDKRKINIRIQRIRKELENIKAKREIQRERRKLLPVPQIAIVGYTNAGKTMLLNKLTNAGMLSEDKLFATLDPTIRQYTLPSRYKVLFSDTVGFIKNLPPYLIAAFRGTLEEVSEADIVLHLMDVTDTAWGAKRKVVYDILKEINAYEGKKIIEVFNKIDLINKRRRTFDSNDAIYISAFTGEGLEKLMKELEKAVEVNFIEKKILVPAGWEKLMQVFYEEGVIVKRNDTEKGIQLTVRAMKKTYDKYSKMVKEKNGG